MRLSAPVFRLKRAAKQHARTQSIALHQALDEIARQEGFNSWSHLARMVSKNDWARHIFSRLQPGDLMLLGGRPGHGKTRLGLDLLIEARRHDHRAVLFTLEYTDQHARAQIADLAAEHGLDPDSIDLETSDTLWSGSIAQTLEPLQEGALAVIDYMQVLDQKRSNPPLSAQLNQLKACAHASGARLVLLSQIDRRFETSAHTMPRLEDVRLPNPADLGCFNKTCFIHDGQIALDGFEGEMVSS